MSSVGVKHSLNEGYEHRAICVYLVRIQAWSHEYAKPTYQWLRVERASLPMHTVQNLRDHAKLRRRYAAVLTFPRPFVALGGADSGNTVSLQFAKQGLRASLNGPAATC